jgi:hypothetical protein
MPRWIGLLLLSWMFVLVVNADTPTAVQHDEHNATDTVEDEVLSQFDFAAAKAGAKIIDKSSDDIVGADNLLETNRDKYMMVPCSVKPKWIVIQLAEDITVHRINLSNLEYFSDTFKEIEFLGSTVYPTKWFIPLGKFVGQKNEQIQSFRVTEGRWNHVRYLKVRFLSHFTEDEYHYCTLSKLGVFGVRSLEKLEREINRLEHSSKPKTDPIDTRTGTEDHNKEDHAADNHEGDLVDLLEEWVPPELTDGEGNPLNQPQHVFEKLANRISKLETTQTGYAKLLRGRTNSILKITNQWISQVESMVENHNRRLDSLLHHTLNLTRQTLEKTEKIEALSKSLVEIENRYAKLEWTLVLLFFMFIGGIILLPIIFCIAMSIRVPTKSIQPGRYQWFRSISLSPSPSKSNLIAEEGEEKESKESNHRRLSSDPVEASRTPAGKRAAAAAQKQKKLRRQSKSHTGLSLNLNGKQK